MIVGVSRVPGWNTLEHIPLHPAWEQGTHLEMFLFLSRKHTFPETFPLVHISV